MIIIFYKQYTVSERFYLHTLKASKELDYDVKFIDVFSANIEEKIEEIGADNIDIIYYWELTNESIDIYEMYDEVIDKYSNILFKTYNETYRTNNNDNTYTYHLIDEIKKDVEILNNKSTKYFVNTADFVIIKKDNFNNYDVKKYLYNNNNIIEAKNENEAKDIIILLINEKIKMLENNIQVLNLQFNQILNHNQDEIKKLMDILYQYS